MKHIDNGPPYPPEVVFVGVGAIYRLNQSWPHSETIHVLDRVVGNMDYEGKHRPGSVWHPRWFDDCGQLICHGRVVARVHRPLRVGEWA